MALHLTAMQGQANSCIRHISHCLQSGRTPLHLAAIQGHANAVLGLLTHDADPNLRDDRGMTALHKAAALGHTSAAEDLLKAKANPERKLQVRPAAAWKCSVWLLGWASAVQRGIAGWAGATQLSKQSYKGLECTCLSSKQTLSTG